MRTLFVCATLTAALMPVSARAQSVVLTESQVLSQLGTESARVRAARSGVDIARADVSAAGRWPNPRVTFNREAVAGVTENMVMVAQPLPITGRRGLEVNAATARVEASSSRAEDQIRRIRADMRLAFTDLWAAQERERELTRSRDRMSDLAGILGRREAAGDAAGFDRLRAEREVVDIDTTRAMVTIERAQAQALLASFLIASSLVIEIAQLEYRFRMIRTDFQRPQKVLLGFIVTLDCAQTDPRVRIRGLGRTVQRVASGIQKTAHTFFSAVVLT